MVSVAGRDLDLGLLERDELVAALDDRLATVRADSEGMFVWIGGEAGVGKTALLRHFCGRQGKPVRVLWGVCEPLRTPRPLGPFVDVAAATGGELAELVVAGGRPYEVAAAVLDELGGRAPTVLVLEDLQWADEATLDVITLLATRIGSVPALALSSYRDDELHRAPALRLVLGEVARRPARLKVEPLSPAAVAALAEPHRLQPAELYERTGGNPFFVTEVLAAGGERLPETVRDAVLARASRLSEDAGRLLEAVAVVPGQVEVSVLQAVAGELIEYIDECLASGVLSSGPTHVAFRHELTRMTVEGAMPPNRRLALNRAALAALARSRDPDFARLAHHAEAAGEAGAVLEWAPRAATRAAASGAHREAADQYARALRFSDGQPPEVSAGLLQDRAEECYLTSQIDDAIDAQRKALEYRRRLDDQRAEGNALRVLSRLLFFAGRASEAEPLVLEAIEVLERQPAGHELAMAYANVSQRRMVVEDTAEAVAWGNRALELARSLGDTEAQVYALSNIGAAEFVADAERGRTGLEAALHQALRQAHEELAGLTFSRLVMFSVRYRRFEIASEHLEAGLAHCTDRGLDTFRLYLLACGARLALDTGHWDEASDLAASVLRDPRAAHVGSTWALTTLGLVRARRGDPEAFVPLEEANAMVTPTFELLRIAQVAAARAEAAWLAGDQDRVAEMTDAAFALALYRQEPWALGELAIWRWRTGLGDDFDAKLAAEPYRLSMAGDWQAAAERWRIIGCPYEAAVAMADADDGVALRQAVEELQSLGARPAAAIVARKLRRRGIRGVPRGPRRSTRENPAGLTARELEVLAMLAQGLRNAQIAARLVVSEKTIDHHVSAILRKLNVHSRGEAAAKAVRLGLTART
jgi:DNA-binding CsgD family transcriptional regulator/tetratricopeptide (TPR) repeat protein